MSELVFIADCLFAKESVGSYLSCWDDRGTRRLNAIGSLRDRGHLRTKKVKGCCHQIFTPKAIDKIVKVTFA